MSKPECSALKSKVFVINPTDINSIDPNQVVLVNKNQDKAVLRVSKKGKNVDNSSSTKGKVMRPEHTVVTIANMTYSRAGMENLQGIGGCTPPTIAKQDSKSKVTEIPQNHMNIIKKAITNVTASQVDIQDTESKNTRPKASNIIKIENAKACTVQQENVKNTQKVFDMTKMMIENTVEKKVQANDVKVTIKTEMGENVDTVTNVTFAQIDIGSELKSRADLTHQMNEVKNSQHGHEKLKIIKITAPENTKIISPENATIKSEKIDIKNLVKYVHTPYYNVSILKKDTNEKSDSSKEQIKLNATSPQNIDENQIQNAHIVYMKPPQPRDKYMVQTNKRKFEDCGKLWMNEHDEKKSPKTIQVLNTVTIPQNEKNTTEIKEEKASKTILKTGSYTKMIGTADHLLIHAPNPAKELQAHTLVIYDSDKYYLSGIKTRMIITHGYDGSADGIKTKVQMTKPFKNRNVVLSESNSDNIVKAIGQTNYETVMNGLLQVPNEHAKVQAILALLKKGGDSIKHGDDKVCQTNESALREIEATKNQLLKRTKYKKKKPYVVTDKHIKMLEIGQKMNEKLLYMKPKLETEMLTDFEKNDDIDERLPYDDNSSVGNVSGLTDFTANTEKLNDELKLLNYNINQVTKNDGPVTVPNLTGQNLFASEVKEKTDQRNVNGFEQAFLSSVQSTKDNPSLLELKMKQTKLNISQIAKTYQPKHRQTLSQSPPNVGQTATNLDQIQANLGHIAPTIGQTSSFGHTQPNLCQISSTISLAPSNQGHNQIATKSHSNLYQNPSNFGQNQQNIAHNQLNVGQNLLNIGQMQPSFGQNALNTGHTMLTMYNQANISQTMQNSVQNPNNSGYKITMSDGYEIWVPVKPEDEFHIATPVNLKALGHQDQRKLILHQAYIDFKYALVMDEDGNYPIHQAVLANDVEWLKRQLCALRMKGKSVDVLSDEGLTALQMSLYSETSTCCTALIQIGADPLMTYDEGRAILHLASERGADYLSDIVHAFGAHARSIIHAHVIELQTRHWDSKSDEELNFALMKHFNTMVDDQGYTPLMLASKMGLYENVRILLECQNKPELTVDYAMPTSGNTALYLAVSAVCSDCQENSNMSVIADNLSKTIECLIENGANLDKVNYAGFSPSSLAQDMNIPGLNTLLSRLNAKKHNLPQDSLMIVRKLDNVPPNLVINDKKIDIMPSPNSTKVNIKPDRPSQFKFDSILVKASQFKPSQFKPRQFKPSQFKPIQLKPRYSVKACLQYYNTGENSQDVQSTSPDNKTQNQSNDINSKNKICNDINAKNEICNDINAKNEICNDIIAKNDICNDINSKNESYNDINSKICEQLPKIAKVAIPILEHPEICEQLPKIAKVAIPILKHPAWRDRVPRVLKRSTVLIKKPLLPLICDDNDDLLNTKVARLYATKLDMMEQVTKLDTVRKLEKSKLNVLNKTLNNTNKSLVRIDCGSSSSSNKSLIRPENRLPVAGEKRKKSSSETETCVKKIKTDDVTPTS